MDTPCRNCQKVLPEEALYCPNCGQKNTDGRISVRTFFSEFFDSVFNLDSKFFKTIRDIFLPGKLTLEYFKGRHKAYSHPLRLFFVMAVIHLTIISITALNRIDLQVSPVEQSRIDFERNEVIKKIEEYNESTSLVSESQQKELIDSLQNYLTRTRATENVPTFSNFTLITVNWDSLKISPVTITYADVVQLSFDELTTKYQINDYLNQVLLRQWLKSMEDPAGFIRFGVANLVWMLFVLITILALVMKGLYFRHNYFFVEHLVFLFHWHAFAFVLMSFYYILLDRIPIASLVFFFIFILWFGYRAMRKYYHQKRMKTVLKFSIVLFVYGFVMSFLVLVTTLVSMLFY